MSTSTQKVREPVGEINIVDPNELNWLFITWNTMEEPVRTDEQGRIVGAAMADSRWVDETTLEVDVRRDVRFQDGEPMGAEHMKRAFDEVQRWRAPHPPGTYLNFDQDARGAPSTWRSTATGSSRRALRATPRSWPV